MVRGLQHEASEYSSLIAADTAVSYATRGSGVRNRSLDASVAQIT